MPGLLANVAPEGLLEYSVVYTDRALNHMSLKFRQVMQDISRLLKSVYRAESVAIVPGSGTFGMESVARQFATDKKCLVLRHGWFSYRWSQILDMGKIAAGTLLVTHPTSLGWGPITINAGATLNQNGFTILNTVINSGGTVVP